MPTNQSNPSKDSPHKTSRFVSDGPDPFMRVTPPSEDDSAGEELEEAAPGDTALTAEQIAARNKLSQKLRRKG